MTHRDVSLAPIITIEGILMDVFLTFTATNLQGATKWPQRSLLRTQISHRSGFASFVF